VQEYHKMGDEGDAQKLKGSGQELKGKVKGVINKL
jgi:uncharacterized protein YjbJ (UPF0337 family)